MKNNIIKETIIAICFLTAIASYGIEPAPTNEIPVSVTTTTTTTTVPAYAIKSSSEIEHVLEDLQHNSTNGFMFTTNNLPKYINLSVQTWTSKSITTVTNADNSTSTVTNLVPKSKLVVQFQ